MTQRPVIRALIVDDEPLARRGIRQMLELHSDVVVIGECRDGREALRALDTLAPDLVFLDVQMAELDGFDVIAQHGPARMPDVVFVTAYDEFAVRAFEMHALDYLVKPLNAGRFAATLDRVRERARMVEALRLGDRLASLLDARDAAREQASASHARRIILPASSGDLVLDVDEIDWIQADDYYAAVHARGKRYLIRESLASLEQRLDPARFARVHRSAIVRLDRIRELRASRPGKAVIVLRDGTRIPVSRRRREWVADILRRSLS